VVAHTPAPIIPEDLRAQWRIHKGLTSIFLKRAIGCFDAISMASSRLPQSRRSKPQSITSFRRRGRR